MSNTCETGGTSFGPPPPTSLHSPPDWGIGWHLTRADLTRGIGWHLTRTDLTRGIGWHLTRCLFQSETLAQNSVTNDRRSESAAERMKAIRAGVAELHRRIQTERDPKAVTELRA